MNPDEFTLRDLLVMTDGRGRMEWGRVSSLMAIIANVHRDPKRQRLSKPADFNPYSEKETAGPYARTKRVKAPLSVLRDVWCRKDRAGKGGDKT